MSLLYMDNAATSFPKPEAVYDTIDYFNRHMGGNPGRGSSQSSLQAGSKLLETRLLLARLFRVKEAEQIAFTANITESINTALKGLLRPGDHVITTSMEHNAVARPLQVMAGQGIEWTAVKCSPEGCLDPGDIEKAIRRNTRLICMLHASNVTGTIMPVAQVGGIARKHGVTFMVDTAQTAGLLSLDVERDAIDILTFTGHKSLLGPQGTGGLYVRPGLVIQPLKEGGTGSLSESLQMPLNMPDRLEAGTMNTPGIVGLGAGVQYILDHGPEAIREHERQMTQVLLDGLAGIKRVKVYGPGDSQRQMAVVAFSLQGVDCGEVSLRLDQEYGIVNRSGLHCAPLAHQTLGTFDIGLCRISPGLFTSLADIQSTLAAIDHIASSK